LKYGYVIIAKAIHVIKGKLNYISKIFRITYKNSFNYIWLFKTNFSFVISTKLCYNNVMKKNVLLEDSQELANKITKLCDSMSNIKNIQNTLFQLRKSGTSINANIREGNYPQSLPDMLSKFQIAKKECFETEGWIQNLFDNEYISITTFKELRNLAGKIRRLLIASCITIEKKIKGVNNG